MNRWAIAGFLIVVCGLAAVVWRVERVSKQVAELEPPYDSMMAEIEDLRGRLATLERKAVRTDRAEKKKKPAVTDAR